MEHYKPLSIQRWENEISSFRLLVINFLESNGYSPECVGITDTAVFQIITKVHQRKSYFSYFHQLNISDFKELALYCFWIIKVKPLFLAIDDASEDDKMIFQSINEKFALFYIIKKFRALAGENAVAHTNIDNVFSEQYMYELIYSFTYRDISKEAMILLVETIAIALGHQPYKPS